jgi:capsular polysaccharide transport system permease protein
MRSTSVFSPALTTVPQRLPALADTAAQAITSLARKATFVAAPAMASRLRPRHRWLIASFVVAVLLPVLVSAWYLWARAADQYASVTGFSVHREDGHPASALLGGLAGFSGSGSSDTDILYDYIHSQQLVSELDASLDLKAIWSKPQGDPVFAFDTSGSVEDLVDYWQDMVSVHYDTATRLIEVRVLAFAPEDAQAVTAAILARSGAMINRLNDIATKDGLRFARAELDRASETLVRARADVTGFRNQHQMVDPGMELAAQSGMIASLQQELTGAQVRLDMLRTTTVATDRRIPQAERRVAVIKAQIAAERDKLAQSGEVVATEGYAELIAEFERLGLERQFAEEAYLAARVAHEAAQANAERQGRYLAAHILPTLPESARFPARGTYLALIAGFALALWSIAALLYYALRDRR